MVEKAVAEFVKIAIQRLCLGASWKGPARADFAQTKSPEAAIAGRG